nr:hypothetical protein [Tanacetum cinerariifolium]
VLITVLRCWKRTCMTRGRAEWNYICLESVEQGPLIWPSVEVEGVTRLKKYSELSAAEAIQADCDVKINIILQGLPPEVYALLVRDLHTTNVDQLHAYLGQHEYHANEVRLMNKQTSDPLALISQHQLNRTPYPHHQPLYQQSQFQPQATSYQSSPYGPSSLTHSISYPGTDTSSLISHNAYMASSSAPHIAYAQMDQQSSKYSPLEAGLVLRTSSNPRQQATINNGRVTIQPIQGRQNFVSAGSSRPFTSGQGGAQGYNSLVSDGDFSPAVLTDLDNKMKQHEKDTVILKLKEKIKSLRADDKERKEESKVQDIETQNVELVHRVTKLTAENNHLKQTYKQLFDSIKSSRVQSKEQCDDLINKVNLKSVKVADLNASLQEKVLVDVVPLIPKLRKNRTAHIDYIKHTLEEAATLRELVESERLLSPLNTPLAYACKYTRRIQELLMILQQICPRITDLGTTLVAVTPKNQNKQE